MHVHAELELDTQLTFKNQDHGKSNVVFFFFFFLRNNNIHGLRGAMPRGGGGGGQEGQLTPPPPPHDCLFFFFFFSFVACTLKVCPIMNMLPPAFSGRIIKQTFANFVS